MQQKIKKAKTEYISNKIQENKGNSKKLWEQLKHLGYAKNCKKESKTVLKIEDELCFDGKKVASYFNNFFTTIASKLVRYLPTAPKMFSTDTCIFKSFYRSKGVKENNFNIKEVTEEYVFKLIKELGVSKSTGLDGLSARFIKDGAHILKGPITHIVNLSIRTSEVPTGLKEARVRPLYKKKNRLEVGNYRPVSILNVISKILEKTVHDQLSNYLVESNLIYEFQSGFRGNHSTDTCLIYLSDLLKVNISKGNYTGLLLLDLQKAFDTVDHLILCDKLKAMGVKSVEWFYSYLTGRKQVVDINGHVSEPCNITCGVPQGSILGPLLFLCYVNDMKISVSCQLLLYADDSILIVSHKDEKVISNELGKELESCNNWMIDNKLSLHIGKTEAMIVGSKRKLDRVNEFSVTCNNQTIKGAKSVKYLGAHLDENASGEGTYQAIRKKINARLKFLYRQASALNQDIKKTLCSALIQPHFDYACSSWFPGLTSKSKKQLQISQNKIVRFIIGLEHRTHIGVTELKKVNMLKVEERVKQLKLNHVYNIYNNVGPSYLTDNFHRTANLHSIRTRRSECSFFVPRVQGMAVHSFFYSAIKEWNSLPSNIQCIDGKSRFKTAVKRHLIEQARNLELNDLTFY